MHTLPYLHCQTKPASLTIFYHFLLIHTPSTLNCTEAPLKASILLYLLFFLFPCTLALCYSSVKLHILYPLFFISLYTRTSLFFYCQSTYIYLTIHDQILLKHKHTFLSKPVYKLPLNPLY